MTPMQQMPGEPRRCLPQSPLSGTNARGFVILQDSRSPTSKQKAHTICYRFATRIATVATYTKRGKSTLAQVRLNGVHKAKSFPTKTLATAWAIQLEAQIHAGKYGKVPDRPVSDLFEKYAAEVSPSKRGAKWEINRLNLLGRDPLAQVRLPQLDAPHIAQWRDRRLKSVAGASVNREWNLLSGVFTKALNEWRLIERHPMKGVQRPEKGKPRQRLPAFEEIARLRHVMGDHGTTIVSRVFLSFMFSIETGMRLGEICRLNDVRGRVAYTYGTKNGDDRQVPLSVEAGRLWAEFGPFAITTQQADIHFRKSCAKAEITGLHFHDARAEAITRLSAKLDILTLAKMVGTRDLKTLTIYYRESAEDVAARL